MANDRMALRCVCGERKYFAKTMGDGWYLNHNVQELNDFFDAHTECGEGRYGEKHAYTLGYLGEDEPTYAPPTPESLRATAKWFRENAPEVRASAYGPSAWMAIDFIAYRLENRRPPHGGDDE